jgi:hypothetical protein
MTRSFTVPATGPALSSEQDALDLMGELYGQEVDRIVIPVTRLAPEFFQLGNGLLGAFLQKFVNYRYRVAIIGDLSAECARSAPLRAFVEESNRCAGVRFAPDEAALGA